MTRRIFVYVPEEDVDKMVENAIYDRLRSLPKMTYYSDGEFLRSLGLFYCSMTKARRVLSWMISLHLIIRRRPEHEHIGERKQPICYFINTPVFA